MEIQSIIENTLVKDEFSVWCLKGHHEFGYTDGAESEKYLQRVFSEAKDLSSLSTELETYIKDWPSEYHLSVKRAQLLSGFTVDRSQTVLEVGCGCGAITRYLGENFNQVISIEGNINRARLARLRTRDLDSVSVICAPFQDIRFSQKFDIIFCIGVFEYSASFIQGDDPYNAALSYFSEMLNPGGKIVIAIENQFGLKYFSGACEDHLGIKFAGLEGYHGTPALVKTFGKPELERMLGKYFSDIQFYYPYPDYKLPSCVVSAQFLASGQGGELVAQTQSRDYSATTKQLFNESSVTLELARNRMLEFFANSFLVVAGNTECKKINFEQSAVIFSAGRRPKFSTKTRIVAQGGGLSVIKRNRQCLERVTEGLLTLKNTESQWFDTLSLQTQLLQRVQSSSATLNEIFKPVKAWVKQLAAESYEQAGVRYLDGEHVDSIWANAYVVKNECSFSDREWVWNKPVEMNAVVVRAIYDFLYKQESLELKQPAFAIRSGRSMIQQIAKAIEVSLNDNDIKAFVQLELDFQQAAFNLNREKYRLYLSWFLLDRPTLYQVCRMKYKIINLYRKWCNRVTSRICAIKSAIIKQGHK